MNINFKRWPLLMGLSPLILPVFVASTTLAQTQPPLPNPKPEMQQGFMDMTQNQQLTTQIMLQERSQAAPDIAQQPPSNPPRPFDSLNLTDQQRARIRQVQDSCRQQMNDILTPEQRQKLQQHRPPNPPGSPPSQAPQ
jgi:Spy/CpxP family protein refolding chaperone